MVSPALSQLLERARVRFGLEVEILDAGLNNVYPDGGTDLSRIITDSPAVRRTLLDAIAGGRPERLEGAGAHYRVYPLKRSATRRQTAGLLAIRRSHSDVSQALDAEPWSDLARAIVEADLASVDMLGEERQRSRRLSGALRFLEYVGETSSEAVLTRALVQAAAVWFDVDARIYRRNLTGDFVLDTWLPGVQPDAASTRLSSHLIGNETDLRRLASAADLGEVGNIHIGHSENEALLVPLTSGRRADWVLALIGTVPREADGVLRLIGRVAGAQFSLLAVRRREEARLEFEALVAQTTKARELVAIRVVHSLVQAVKASSGSLTLSRSGHTRRIAAIGPAPTEPSLPLANDSLLTPDRFVCVLPLGPLGDSHRAVLEVRAAGGNELTADAAAVAQSCATVLRTWFAGTLSSFDATTVVLEPEIVSVPAFSSRIQEELERAKRFDLRLSLILIEVTAPSDAVAQLQVTLRRELRGSDVTGAMSGRLVAVLLTHTDALGLDNVVRRLKQRLADAAERLNVSDLKLGQAAFSPEMRTADALLELALRQSEPVIVH
jgi:hypothetical protein